MSQSGKNWEIDISANYVYDSNVVASPEDDQFKPTGLTDEDDSGFAWDGTATYDLEFTKKFKMDFNYDIYQIVYDELSDYDIITQMFGTGMTYKLSRMADIQVDYKYVYNLVDNESFSGFHFINPSFNYFHDKFGFTRIDAWFKEISNINNRTRDGDQWSAGFTHYFLFSNYTRRISVGYRFSQDDTTGSAFDRDIHDFTVRGLTPLYWGVLLDAKAKLSVREYDEFIVTDGSLRDDDQQIYSAALSKVLVKKAWVFHDVTASAKYTHLFNKSNLATRTYRSNRYTVGFSTSF